MSDGTQVQQRIEDAAEARHQHGRLTRRLEEAQQRVAALEAEVQRCRARLAEEASDVEKLESFSPARIWAGLKGSHASDLERETAERETARYAVAEAEARLLSAQADREQLQARREELGDVEATYSAALRAKEEWLAGSDPVLAGRLSELSTERGELLAQDQENREAFDAGCRARDHLAHAASLLGSAGSWAAWDTFGGGGLLTDMMKYDKLDQASAVLRAADQALRVFSRELADVGGTAVPAVQVESMTRTFDVWFDNIFSDMAVRHRIREAAAQVSVASGAVEQALSAIQASGRRIVERLRELGEERERLLS